MKFTQNFLPGPGVLTAGAGGEITRVCTALPKQEQNLLPHAKNSILKLVKLQSSVAKCCQKQKNIALQILQTFVLHYHYHANFSWNVVDLP